MYARVTTYQIDPVRIAEMQAKLVEVKPQVKALGGVVNTYTAWRADGQGVVMAVFESKAAAEAAADKIQAIWGGLASLLKGPPKVEAFDNVEHLSG